MNPYRDQTKAPKTNSGQSDDREYSTEVTYSGSDQDWVTVGSGGNRRGVKLERSELVGS